MVLIRLIFFSVVTIIGLVGIIHSVNNLHILQHPVNQDAPVKEEPIKMTAEMENTLQTCIKTGDKPIDCMYDCTRNFGSMPVCTETLNKILA